MGQAEVDAVLQEAEVPPVLVLARTFRSQIVVSLIYVSGHPWLTALRGVDEISVTRAEEDGLLESIDSRIDRRLAACFSVRQSQLSETERTRLIDIPERVTENPGQAGLGEVVTSLGCTECREPIVADSQSEIELVVRIGSRLRKIRLGVL